MNTHPHTTPAERPAHSRPLTLILAEDHPLYRQGLARAVGRRPLDLELIGEAEDGAEAVALIEALRPDVAVVDMRLPGLDGLEVCQRAVSGEAPAHTRVMILSAFDDPDLVWQAVNAGASGYIDKSADPDDVIQAILQVGRGGTAFTDRTAEGVNRGFERLYHS